MAAPVLTEEQREKLIEWITAGFPQSLIDSLFDAHGWKRIHQTSITHYRQQHRDAIEARLAARMERAYDAGLAQREARIKALVDHAEELKTLMWLPDDKGKLHNEKAWRETLDDIAREMGHRRTGVDLNVGRMSDAELIAEAASCLGGTGPAPSEDDESV